MIRDLGARQVVLDLRRAAGTPESIASRIPTDPGVYAWFPSFSVPTDSPHTFLEALRKFFARRHSADRTAILQPLFRVTLEPYSTLPAATARALEQLAEIHSFRRFLSELLNNSLHFLRPLYIGKAINLRDRILDHLNGVTPLLERLGHAGIDLFESRLYLLCLEDHHRELLQELEEKQLEQTLEDLLSRLFHPAFTLKYG